MVDNSIQKNIVKKILVLLIAMTMIFACFAMFACSSQERDTELTLDNYSAYLNIWSAGLGGAGGVDSMRVITSVRISRRERVELENVHITYVFRANEASETFTHSLGRLVNMHSQDVSLSVAGNFSWGVMSLLDINVSIEVIEISGGLYQRHYRLDNLVGRHG